jgi:cobalt-precorrin 5A hydrolase/precorrin-3B C17-methyltransferase
VLGAVVKRVLAVSLTERGRALTERLPYEHSHGSLAATVQERWDDVDGFVLVAAVGACVRIVAPLLTGKQSDPAVVCVDDGGRFAVSLIGGHSAGANDLAGDVARMLGAEAVITTATDATGTVAIDRLSGYPVEGDVAAVTAALLDGRPVSVDNPLAWPLAPALRRALALASTPDVPALAPPTDAGASSRPDTRPTIVVTDLLARQPDAGPGAVAVLRPPSLVAGIGASTDPPAEELAGLLRASLAEAGLSDRSLRAVATIDRRATEPAVESLGLPVVAFTSSELAEVDVPNPSEVVRAAVGTGSVAEAAALLAAGPGATLVLTKRASPHCTVALARASRPRGHIAVVGLGPGGAGTRTPDADRAIRGAQVVIGYEAYVNQCRDLLGPSQEVVLSPIGAEVERAREAVARADAGELVAVVCSGDPGVYAMASLVLEEAGEVAGSGDRGMGMGMGMGMVTIVPGVTAALAAAAELGAPLGHDHVMISLSDLLTPWEMIVTRVIAARDADLVLALYNPRSKARDWQLAAVRDLLLQTRDPVTPVGIATDIGRPDASTTITTLAGLDPDLVGMTTCVIIGSSTTRVVAGRMVTPRGYRRTTETPATHPPTPRQTRYAEPAPETGQAPGAQPRVAP